MVFFYVPFQGQLEFRNLVDYTSLPFPGTTNGDTLYRGVSLVRGIFVLTEAPTSKQSLLTNLVSQTDSPSLYAALAEPYFHAW